MENYENPGKRFRELIDRPQGVFGYGVENALGALMGEMAGSEAIYAGGWSIAGSKARPDMGQVTMTEQRDAIRDIVRATKLPVIADIDDGYGDAKNVLRTVSEFFGTLEYDFETRAVRRLAGIHIEDQVLPKRCGHIAGKELISLEKMRGKIRVASRARDDVFPSGVIIARTDAFNSKIPGSMDEAVKRATAYVDAGADLLWCEFNQCNRALPEAFAEGVQKRYPLIQLAFNYSPSLPWAKTPIGERLVFSDLVRMGYKFIFVTIADFHAHSMASYDYAKRFRDVGAEALWEMQERKKEHPTENHQALMRVEEWQKFESKFVPGAEARQKEGEGFKNKK
ncbi:MAG: isocitrate lyase/PEP mutase family protein [bacterium]|nr:isocitrate lyase/PEP mutase family protein [bacterium]